jgi:hypothetical protein
MEKETTSGRGLVGLWFHTFIAEEFEKRTIPPSERHQRRIQHQGQIVGNPEPGFYLAQYQSKGSMGIIHISEMARSGSREAEWCFYETEEEMYAAYNPLRLGERKLVAK